MKIKKYQLIVSHNQKTEPHILDKQKPLRIKAQKNTVYKIVDENGEVLHNPIVKTMGDDVYVYLPDDTSASLLLENFQTVSPITDINTLTNLNASLATQSDVVVSTFWESTASKMAISAMGLAGTLAIINQGKNNNHDNNAPVPVSAKVVSVNTIQSIEEGDILTVAITLNNANGSTRIPFDLSGLTTEDYGTLTFSNGVTQNTDGTLNIPQGVTSFTVSLPILADQATEGNETLRLKVGEQSKEVVINDISTTPIVVPPPTPIPAKVANIETVQNINESETLTASVTLDNANGAENVAFNLSGLTTEDYGTLTFSNGVTQNTDGTLNIPQGVTSFTVSLPILADQATEGNETLRLTVGEQSKEVVINDISTTPVVVPPPTPILAKVATVEVIPNANEGQDVVATVTLDNANGAENIAFNLSGLQADDYGTLVFSNSVTQNSNGTLNIPQGVTEFTVTLPIIADEVTEGNETLTLKVGEQEKEVVVNDTSTTPVVVPPPTPIPAKFASVDIPTSINESETLTATVTLDNSNGAENIPFAITGLTTDDYGTLTFSNGVTQNSDGTLNIPQGVTEFTVSLPIIANNQTEGNKTLTLKIGEQEKEVVVNDTSITPVVVPPPTPIPAKFASVDIPTSINESETLTATVTLDNSNGAENIPFAITGLTTDDYGTLTFNNGVTQNTNGTLNIPQGVTEFTVTLPIIADEVTEGNETLTLKVGEQEKEVVVKDTSITPVVVPPPAPIPAKVANIDIPTNINENETLTATVTLDNSNGAENIAFNLSGLQADDYGTLVFNNGVTQNTDGALNIPQGITEFTVSLPILADQTTEGNETLRLTVGEQSKEVVINDISTTPIVVPPTPSIPLEITINAIDDGMINIADKSLSFTLTGTVNFDPTTREQQVIVKIGEQDHPATLTGNTWTLDVSGETLAFAEGSQTLTAILTAKDHTGASVSTNATGSYNVDTQIDTPVITFDNLTNDNIINLAESNENLVVSGTVENAKDGDIVKVIIGGVSQDVSLQGGKFSLTVAGSTLKNHTSISATVITTDTAGNTATGEQTHSYEVDTTAPTPKITLNPITGDNHIDLSEQNQPTTTITGNIDNFVKTDTNEFVLICLCSTCTSNNQKTVEARLNDDGTFSADIATDELTKYDSISATIKSTDTAGNTGQDTNTQTYTVEQPVIPPLPTAPSITLNPIAGDNIVNAAEFNYGSSNPNIAITGKIERADVANSTVKLEFYKAGVLAKTVDSNLGADGVYTYRISGAELHRSYDTVKAILMTNGQEYSDSQSYKAAAYSPRWGDVVPTFVSDDNVIDQNDTWQEFTTMTGTFNSIRNTLTAEGIENAMDITVTVNGKPYATTVTGQTGTFSINIKTADLLADTDKVADISAYLYDNAGNNAGTKTTTLKYSINDTDISTPVLTVNPIDNINIAYQNTNPTTTLTGFFEIDGDVALANAPLTVEIGGQSFTAQKTVTSSGNGQKTIGTWTLDVPTQTLINANGNLTAKLSATDYTNNQAQADTPATYKVDVNAPSVEIKLNAMTGDNAITPNEIADTFTITGTVTGEYQTSDKVNLTIGNETYRVDVINGEFSQAVPKAVILANTAVNASFSTQDALGNTGFDDDSLIYNVTAKDIKIEFDPITSDNLINVSEQSTPIEVSGKVIGADAKAGQTVQIKVGEQTFTTTVGMDLTFKTQINGQLLTQHKGYTISVQVLENGEFLASNTHNYDVQNDVSASIKITSIGDNTSDNGVADGFGSVRLSGKLALNDSIFAQGYNSDSLEAMVVKIGDKSFNAGFNRDDMSFHIDLSKSEVDSLNGQAISYEFITSGTLYYLAGAGNAKTVRQVGARDGVVQSELGKISIDWQGNTKAQDGVTTLSTPTKTTAITGIVSGSAQVGDDITVAIGGQNYTTKIQDGNVFVVNVDSETLAKHTGNITATLATKDLEGKAIRVNDVVIHNNATQSTGDFVSKHTHTSPADRKIKHTDDDYNFAYMIDSVASDTRGGFLSYTHTPFGGFSENGTPAKIKYYFATQAETTSPDWQYQGRGYVAEGSTRDFSENLKTFVKNSLAKYAAIANIEFVEVGSYQEVGGAGINFIYGDAIGAFASSGAFAYGGGNVVFDTGNFSDNPNPGNYHHYLTMHELFHTFSGKHTDGVYSKYGFATPEDYTSEFSVMSYSPNYHWNLGFQDLSIYDVMYMHYRFGVARTVNVGNDVYGFGNYASLIQDGTIYIADASGVDTFDASYEQEGVTVNLTPGSWIYRTSQKSDTFVIKEKTTIEGNNAYFANQDLSGYTLSGNVGKYTHTDYVKGQGFIGYGTQIENLKGSNFADVLTGNNADNNIFGNDGDDKIDGGLGNDYLDGGKGADILIGGQGNDSYVIDNTGDTITELAGEGTDTVYSYIDYTLGEHLENITLLGYANLSATGNRENNTLIGNSGNNTLIGGAGDDTLDGGRGNDTLTGGDGADYFRFSTLLDGSVDIITDFDVATDKIQLDDAIFTALAGQTTVGDFVKYDKDTGKLTYDADGAGVGNAIHFATLKTGLDENQIQYQII